ncbi:MAG TPA: ABC transporter permease [Terriglobales bacterium]|nr:ABC transporter permease [Terriglobales bacterium]
MGFPSFVALRYLRPRRGRGLVSVVTAIAVLGFAAGVGALILALAVTSGFRDALQQELVGATAEVNLLRKDPAGISNYRNLMSRLAALPHVRAVAPAVYQMVILSRGARVAQVTLKGIEPKQELRVSNMLDRVQVGSWQPLAANSAAHDLVIGDELSRTLGAGVGDWVDVYVPQAVLTPLGYEGRTTPFRVVGIFRSGFSDFDGGWAYTGFQAAQQLAPGSGDFASVIEFRLDDIYRADPVAAAAVQMAGPAFTSTTWMSQNRAIFQALKTQRLGTIIVIGLIVFVAGMNVLILLSMLVLEKRKEIAVLQSLGARRRQIRRIFVLQGVFIDLVGTAVGLAAAYGFAWAANRYHWIHISSAVYAMDYVPFHARWSDGVLVAVLALVVSVLASVYPAGRAVRVRPAETLRYE